MYIIGLTGGTSCGKSAVAETLRRYFGATTFDVDTVTRWLLKPGGELFDIYVRHFGRRVIENGLLNRKLIGEIIFNNPAERKWINSVAHPVLLNKTRDFLVDCQAAGVRLVALEIPLLFEAGWEILVDETWAIYIPREYQISRLMTRDKITEEQAMARINAQMGVWEICRRADVKIRNVGGYAKVRKRIHAALRNRIF